MRKMILLFTSTMLLSSTAYTQIKNKNLANELTEKFHRDVAKRATAKTTTTEDLECISWLLEMEKKDQSFNLIKAKSMDAAFSYVIMRNNQNENTIDTFDRKKLKEKSKNYSPNLKSCRFETTNTIAWDILEKTLVKKILNADELILSCMKSSMYTERIGINTDFDKPYRVGVELGFLYGVLVSKINERYGLLEKIKAFDSKIRNDGLNKKHLKSEELQGYIKTCDELPRSKSTE